eukprot:gnl/MRDRNA2_/MRDRNA2_30898_c0_seq1.p1 gnl/MRDRNA2_/MRDRNA2_30898_c0~~gnl/MRDRNA2_/MRDRNA2_30898_c0_seq1.p1  ORF type:complete len:561 (+),score=54.34 gnl/MRDRNA2_/MRDRNA2_30898_c0_seq1:95-1777(+)
MVAECAKDVPGATEQTPLVEGVNAQLNKQKSGVVQPASTYQWLLGLRDVFGIKLMVMLVCSQHAIKGFQKTFVDTPTQYVLSGYNVAGPRMQLFGSVISLPWAMKPLIGLWSDLFPIFGYHKAPYIVLSALMGGCACLAVGLVPQSLISVESVVLCLFAINLQCSTTDLLCEAKYAQKMRENPAHGPDLMSFVWGGLQASSLLAVVLVGRIMSHWGNHFPYVIAAIPSAIILIPTFMNYLEEQKASAADLAKSRERLMQQKEACVLCVIMFFSTILLSVVGTIYEDPYLNATIALTVMFVLLIMFSLVLSPVVAKVNAFFLIQTSCSLSVGGASFYFYTDTPAQYPEGPHFSQFFYVSVLGVVGGVCSLIGVASYQQYMRDWSYQKLLLWTNLALSVFSLSDCVLFSRLNVRLGLPDHAFVLGASVCGAVVAQWMWMPGVVILSQLCPKGMEATMYALLAGCHNMGGSVAANCGAAMLQYMKVTPSGANNESHQFDGLWSASLVSTALPLLTVVLLPWLIPNAKQTDTLIDDNDGATGGSLLKSCLGERDKTSDSHSRTV